jgi:hypothetical protein
MQFLGLFPETWVGQMGGKTAWPAIRITERAGKPVRGPINQQNPRAAKAIATTVSADAAAHNPMQ